jgi:hypothetical protein
VGRIPRFESLSVVLGSEGVTNSSKQQVPDELPPTDDGPAAISLAQVRCRERLGGLLKHCSPVLA